MCFLGFIRYNKTFIACRFRKYENPFTLEYHISLTSMQQMYTINCLFSKFKTFDQWPFLNFSSMKNIGYNKQATFNQLFFQSSIRVNLINIHLYFCYHYMYHLYFCYHYMYWCTVMCDLNKLLNNLLFNQKQCLE